VTQSRKEALLGVEKPRFLSPQKIPRGVRGKMPGGRKAVHHEGGSLFESASQGEKGTADTHDVKIKEKNFRGAP